MPSSTSDTAAGEPLLDAAGGTVADGVEGPARRYRARRPGRKRAVLVRLNDEEYEVLAAAAAEAGLTPTGFAGQAALAAARGASAPSTGPLRAALVELMAARRQLRGYAVNVNQAAKVLNAGGAAPGWTQAAAVAATRAVARVDAAAAVVRRRL